MAEVVIFRYKSNAQFLLKYFFTFVLILYLVLEYFDLRSFVCCSLKLYRGMNNHTFKIFASVYQLKLQLAVIVCCGVIAALYGTSKKKRCFFTPIIIIQFIILMKSGIVCILSFLDGQNGIAGSLIHPSGAFMFMNTYYVLAKTLNWSLTSGFIIQFGLGVFFLFAIICRYLTIESDEINKKDKPAPENNVFDYQSSPYFCCSRFWLRIATFFVLVYRLIVANLEIYSDFICYRGFQSFKPGWIVLSDILSMYFIIEQVATVFAFYALFMTDSKVLKCYVKFLIIDLIKETVTVIYPILLDLPDRGLDPLNVAKIFISKNGHDLWGTYVYLLLASCSVVVIYVYTVKLERNSIIVENFETIDLTFRNQSTISLQNVSVEKVR